MLSIIENMEINSGESDKDFKNPKKSYSKSLKAAYDLKKRAIEEFVDIKNRYTYMFSKNLFRMVDSGSGKVVLEGEYQNIGVFNQKINMFYRSDSLPFIDRSEYKKFISLLGDKIDLSKDLMKKTITSYEYEKYSFYLDNKVIFCSKDELRELVCFYAQLGEFVFEIEKDDNMVNLILLLDLRKI